MHSDTELVIILFGAVAGCCIGYLIGSVLFFLTNGSDKEE